MHKGKVQERMVVFPSADLLLEGLYHKGIAAPGIVVASPHPRYGGSMDSPVVAEVAFGAAREKHPTLRFNYRGVGASQGPRAERALSPPGDRVDVGAAPAPEVDDYRAALAELRATTGFTPMVAAGYSFGAAIALAIARTEPDIAGAILVSPPTKGFDFSRIPELRVPTLIAAGTHDDWLTWSELESLARETPDVKLASIQDANHVFDRGLVALARVVSEFVGRLTE